MRRRFLKAPGSYLFIRLLIVMVSISCAPRDKYDVLLEDSIKEFPIMRPYQWSIIHGWENPGSVTLEATGINADTSCVVNIERFVQDSIRSDQIRMDFFTKSWVDGDSTNIQEYEQGGKLKYWYRVTESNPEVLRFISGYHTFLYQRGGMNYEQREFYIAHRDSLSQLSGVYSQ